MSNLKDKDVTLHTVQLETILILIIAKNCRYIYYTFEFDVSTICASSRHTLHHCTPNNGLGG